MQEFARSFELFRTIRCLDCESMDSSVEYVESPMAVEER